MIFCIVLLLKDKLRGGSVPQAEDRKTASSLTNSPAADFPEWLKPPSSKESSMRARLLFIIVAIVLVAGFAAQNWPEFQRTAPLNFGVVVSNAPLGTILLGILLLSLVLFLISSAAQESRHLVEHRRYARNLE